MIEQGLPMDSFGSRLFSSVMVVGGFLLFLIGAVALVAWLDPDTSCDPDCWDQRLERWHR